MRRLRAIARNTAAILMSDVVNRAAVFVLYALVARTLGAASFGQLSLALALFYTFQVIAVAGLKTLVIREVAKDRSRSGEYLVNAGAVVVLSSLVALGLLAAFVRLMEYPADTAAVVLLLALGLLPFALTAICEATIQGWERMPLIPAATVPVNLTIIGLVALALSRGYDLLPVILLLIGGYTAVLAIEAWLVVRLIGWPTQRPRLAMMRALVRSGSVFLGIEAIVAASSSLTLVLLARLTTATEVGLYSAATQLLVPAMLIFDNLVLSIFPIMCRRFDPNLRDLRQIARHLIELLMALAVPATVGIILLAEPLLLLLFGDPEFAGAAGALRILAGNLMFVAVTAVIGRVLLASLRERLTLRIVVLNGVVGLVLGVVLIDRYGLLGAALATLAVGLVNLVQHLLPVAGLLDMPALAALAWKPVVASAAMAAYLMLAQPEPVLLAVAVGGLIYLTVLLGLVIVSGGGLRQVAARYAPHWAD